VLDRPEEAETIGDDGYRRIRSDIIFGVLTPSGRLKLDSMKEDYGLSVSTLRETANGKHVIKASQRLSRSAHMTRPPLPAGSGGPVVCAAAQALGLRPWLAALPLRERRLRARLLMSAPNGGLSSVRQ